MDIGKKIKEMRMEKGLTLEELAKRSELSKGFLSQLERNKTSPSIQTLDDILEVLGSSLSEFFKEENNSSIIFKEKDYYINEQDDKKVTFIVPNAQKNMMEPIILELEANGCSDKITPSSGEELIYVLEGKVILNYLDNEYEVNSGETIYLSSKHTHYLKNGSDKKSKVLWISSPPNF